MTGGGGRVRWEEEVVGKVGGDRDGRGMRKGAQDRCKEIISRGWERGKYVERDGASPPVM